MAKRSAEDVEDGNQAYLKRQKISSTGASKTFNPPEEIRSSRQLRQILTFDQDAGRAKHGMSLKCSYG
jgi:nucleolar pre-ribosomal-associated protein 1